MPRDLKFVKDLQTCRIGSKLPRLDFAGNLSSLVGSNASKAGIPYTCLVRSQLLYFNAYVPVGTLGLAQAVISCIDWRPARFLTGAGAVGSMLELCGLKASENVHYVGLQSLTALPVRGVVGESVVLELVRQARKRSYIDCPLKGRDAGRPTIVVWAKINEPDNIEGELHVVGSNEGALLGYVAFSVCVTMLVLMAMCSEFVGLALVAAGMILNAMMAYLLREQKFAFPDANPAKGVPPGDAVIQLTDDPDVFCVLRGTETAIQKLLQKEVKLDAGWVKQWPLFLVAVACQIYAAAVVLGAQHMKSSAQLMFLIAVGMGAITDLVKGSFDCKRHIAKEAIKKFGIETVEVKRFGNRTASVASVAAGSTKLDTLKATELLPTAGPVWQSWWTTLDILRDQSGTEREVQRRLKKNSARVLKKLPSDSTELWETLKTDMFNGHADAPKQF